MALDTGTPIPRSDPATRDDSSALTSALSAVLTWIAAMRARLDIATLAPRFARTTRDVLESLKISFHTNTLTSRILALNVVVLIVILFSIFWFSKTESWLIQEKTANLRTQGEIIAAAIASGMRDTRRQRITFDPDSLFETGGDLPPRGDQMSKLELTIRPERIAFILHKLVQPTGTRARVYDRKGGFVVDSDMVLDQGLIDLGPLAEIPETAPKNIAGFWERMRAWFDRADLPVYKDIGRANGTTYTEVRLALRGATTPLLLINDDGQRIISVAVPIRHVDTVQGAIMLSTRGGDIDALVRAERQNIFYVALLALLAILLSSVVIAHKFGRPMHDLSTAADHVRQSLRRRQELPDLTHRNDEIGRLSGTLRDMTAALYQRIETSERFAADVAHELKNPLTSVRSAAETLRIARTHEQRHDLTKTIEDDVRRLTRLIDDISKASRLDADMTLTDLEPVDMAELLRTLESMFNDCCVKDDQQVTLAFEGADPNQDGFFITGHESPLGQVVRNLLDNALSFSPPDGIVAIRATRDADAVVISIEDDGPGIPHDNLKRIFSRFYTDRPGGDSFGKNSGLGLSISQDIIRAHRGEITASNRTVRNPMTGAKDVVGACFRIRLPAPDRRPKAARRQRTGATEQNMGRVS